MNKGAKQQVIEEPLLEGKNITLEGLTKKHVSQRYADWLNDKEICRENSHGRYLNTLEMTENYVTRVDHSETIAVFAIIDKHTSQHIGNISLGNISWENNSAEIAILIGEKDFWGKGIASEAYSLVIDYGFNKLGLHRLYSGMTTRNKAMIKVAEKSGMSYEGTFKDAFYKDSQYCDLAQYAIINPQHKISGGKSG
ncbi:MAG: GNAT family N-acetyltransferase [Candidatus Omnitrophica bacterium]|nr:GNAT family N-acetyltransferase [Candidatus Omnitrophota bacterium]